MVLDHRYKLPNNYMPFFVLVTFYPKKEKTRFRFTYPKT